MWKRLAGADIPYDPYFMDLAGADPNIPRAKAAPIGQFLAESLTPYGDYVAVRDAMDWYKKPEHRTPINTALVGLGLLPLLPPLASAGRRSANALMDVLTTVPGSPGAQGGAIAYHGSPHTFEKFDPAKIGTGEGAQAYGHGLYFAENPAVAKEYSNVPTDIHLGNLYKVDISDDDIAKMLDWDKPLGEQPEGVRAGIKAGADKYDELTRVANALGDTKDDEVLYAKLMDKRARYSPFKAPMRQPDKYTGNAIYHALTGGDRSLDAGVAREASETLKSLGIPGIRYLDQGSRAAGRGTRNFVVFDPENVNILERHQKSLDLLKRLAEIP